MHQFVIMYLKGLLDSCYKLNADQCPFRCSSFGSTTPGLFTLPDGALFLHQSCTSLNIHSGWHCLQSGHRFQESGPKEYITLIRCSEGRMLSNIDHRDIYRISLNSFFPLPHRNLHTFAYIYVKTFTHAAYSDLSRHVCIRKLHHLKFHAHSILYFYQASNQDSPKASYH